MKKLLASILFCAMLPVLAQDAVEDADICHTWTFFDVVMDSGFIGLLVWLMIFSLIFLGLIFGVLSVFACAKVKSPQAPLALKLLGYGLAALLLLGMFGLANGLIGSFRNIGLLGSSISRVQALALNAHMALHFACFSLFGGLGYLLFITISVVALHSRQKKLLNKVIGVAE